MPLFLLAGHAAQAHQHPTDAQVNDGDVITVTAPLYSPLTIVTSPKTPRQPVPASDGSDYLKTIPGFSQIRNGGTNGDPVFRGMFGSRLKILTDGSEMLGACPSRMDAPTSYISPESFDLLTITKGPQTVLWGRIVGGHGAFRARAPALRQTGHQGQRQRADRLQRPLGREYRRQPRCRTRLPAGDGQQIPPNDYQDGTNTRVPSRWDKWNGDLALGWTPDNDTLLEVTMGRGNGEARYAGRSMDGSQFKRESLGMRVENPTSARCWISWKRRSTTTTPTT